MEKTKKGNSQCIISPVLILKIQKFIKIMNPIFHRATPAAAFASVTLKLFRVIDDTQAAGSHVAVPILMKRLALEALGRTMFGWFNRVKVALSKCLYMYYQVSISVG